MKAKRLCIDLDGVVCKLRGNTDIKYEDLEPVDGAVEKMQSLKAAGHYIILYTARRMRTHQANVGAVVKDIGLVTQNWLEKYNIPYDEIYFGKPWADIYIDDNAFRFDSWDQISLDGDSLPISHEKKEKLL